VNTGSSCLLRDRGDATLYRLATALFVEHEVAELIHHGNYQVYSVSVLAEIVARIPRLSNPASASIPARDAKRGVLGRERAPRLSRPFSSCRMSSVSSGFGGRFRRRIRGKPAVPASHAAGLCSVAKAGSA
jgi:hypothetical protein